MWIGTGANNFVTRHVLVPAGKWVSYKNPISLLIMLLTLALATSASAEVIINSPSGGSTVDLDHRSATHEIVEPAVCSRHRSEQRLIGLAGRSRPTVDYESKLNPSPSDLHGYVTLD